MRSLPSLDCSWLCWARSAAPISLATPIVEQPFVCSQSVAQSCLSDLSRQRSIDHTEEVSDRALVHAELRIVIGGRLQGDDLLLCLASGFELRDALARLGEHCPIL